MRKRFWKTPPEIKEAIRKEFGITLDVCPFPKPEGWDALTMRWDDKNFVNPPFRKEDGGGFGPTAFVRKAIEENNGFCLPSENGGGLVSSTLRHFLRLHQPPFFAANIC